MTCEFISNFFTGSSSTKAISLNPKTPQSGWQLIHGYLDTTAGAWDLSRCAELVCNYIGKMPFLSRTAQSNAQTAQSIFAITGSALSIPQVLNEAHTWTVSVCNLFSVSSARPEIVGRVVKRFFVSSSDLGNAVTQALTFFHDSKLVDLGKAMPGIGIAFNVTALFSDGLRFIEEMCGLAEGKDPLLRIMKLAMVVSSIALAVIGLAVLAGALTMSSPWVSIPILILSTVWLTAKISSYFYTEQARFSGWGLC